MRSVLFAVLLLSAAPLRAQDTAPAKPAEGPVRVESIDRVVVRWYTRATGGERKPHFITARQLAFAARVEALREQTRQTTPYTDKHVRNAIQRIVTETMLASLPIDPKPTPKQVATYAEAARGILAQSVGLGDATLGTQKIDEARRAEGISNSEVDDVLRTRARASFYLDRMIAPMLEPSDLDLREVHRRGETPFTEMRFDDVEKQIRQWYVSTRLATALDRYFRNARSRIRIFVIEPPLPTKSRRR